MTEQECLGIDCAWCANPNCPREKGNMETEELQQETEELQQKTEELQQKIKDQKIYIVGLKYQIEQLTHKLENFENYQREKCCECHDQMTILYAEKAQELFDIKEKLKELSE